VLIVAVVWKNSASGMSGKMVLARAHVLGGANPKPSHREGWRILRTEAERRGNQLPPTEACMPRDVFETLPIAIQGLLAGE
jgi:hypothetical protein